MIIYYWRKYNVIFNKFVETVPASLIRHFLERFLFSKSPRRISVYIMIVPSLYEVNSVCRALIPANLHFLHIQTYSGRTGLSPLYSVNYFVLLITSYLKQKTSQWSHEHLLHGSNISLTFQAPCNNSWNHCCTLRYHYGQKYFLMVGTDGIEPPTPFREQIYSLV